MTDTLPDTLVQHCALCAGEKPHAIMRRSIDGRGRPFTVTANQCTDCTVRMLESAKKLALKRAGL